MQGCLGRANCDGNVCGFDSKGGARILKQQSGRYVSDSIREELPGTFFDFGGSGKEKELMWDKLRKLFYEACDVLELLMAAAVFCGIVVATITLWPELFIYWQNRMHAGAFLEYLDAVFNVVIGIEFMKMLCKPSSANIIEVLVFLIARHMIVQTTTPLEDLLSILSISLLFIFRRLMLMTKPDEKRRVPNIIRAIKKAQSPRFREAVIKEQEEKETNADSTVE